MDRIRPGGERSEARLVLALDLEHAERSTERLVVRAQPSDERVHDARTARGDPHRDRVAREEGPDERAHDRGLDVARQDHRDAPDRRALGDHLRGLGERVEARRGRRHGVLEEHTGQTRSERSGQEASAPQIGCEGGARVVDPRPHAGLVGLAEHARVDRRERVPRDAPVRLGHGGSLGRQP
jgi:hypothetical protein